MKNTAKRLFVVTLAMLFGAVFFMPLAARAAVAAECGRNGFLGFPHWYEYLDVELVANDPSDPSKGSSCQVVGPMKAGDDRIDFTAAATRVILAVIDILLRVAGVVAFGVIVFSGFQFVLTRGDPGREKAARETLINAAIGLVITVMAVTLVTYIGRQLVK